MTIKELVIVVKTKKTPTTTTARVRAARRSGRGHRLVLRTSLGDDEEHTNKERRC